MAVADPVKQVGGNREASSAGRPASSFRLVTRNDRRGTVLAAGSALVVFLMATGLRLWDLNRPDLKSSDEGIHLEQLYLMAAGFRPFQDMAVVQGPLELDYFYLFFNGLGRDISAARAGSVAGSLVCLAAIFLSASRMGGLVCGLAALVLLGISPLFLATSRKVIAEAPSMAPGCLALWLALAYRSSGMTSVLLASAICYALGLFLKPMSFAVAIPIFVALAACNRVPARDVLYWVLVVLFSGGLLVLAIGPEPLYQEFVANRLSAASLRWSPEENLQQIVETLGVELPLLALAVGGIWPLARIAPSYAAAATSWFAVAAAMLLLYSPLWPKHVSYLLPPAALLAGGGLGAALRTLSVRPFPSRLGSLAPAGLALVWYVSSLPSSFGGAWGLITQDSLTTAERNDLADVLALITANTTPNGYVVTDHPHLAFLAKRLVPPRLVEPSETRLESKALKQQDFIQETRRFEPEVVVLWSRRSRELAGYAEWLEHDYSLVRVYGSLGAVYAREPLPLDVPGVATPLADQARFGEAVSLAGVELQPFGSGRDYLVNLTWRALQTARMTPYAAHLELQLSNATRLHDRAGLLPWWRTHPWPAWGERSPAPLAESKRRAAG